MEIWLPVPFDGFPYLISNTGKVKSLDRTSVLFGKHPKLKKGKEIKPFFNPLTKKGSNRYLRVKIWRLDGEGKKNVTIHRMVAIAFVPNPNNLPEVNHKDGNKLNNNDWNLEWSTKVHNIQHAKDLGLMDFYGRKKLAAQPVV